MPRIKRIKESKPDQPWLMDPFCAINSSRAENFFRQQGIKRRVGLRSLRISQRRSQPFDHYYG